MDRNVKEYRYVVTYTEGKGWWFIDPTGLFWEGSNIWDHELGEFLEPKQITTFTSYKEEKVAEELYNAIEVLNDSNHLDYIEEDLTEEERVALCLPPLPKLRHQPRLPRLQNGAESMLQDIFEKDLSPAKLTDKDRIGYL